MDKKKLCRIFYLNTHFYVLDAELTPAKRYTPTICMESYGAWVDIY